MFYTSFCLVVLIYLAGLGFIFLIVLNILVFELSTGRALDNDFISAIMDKRSKSKLK